jgi:hypothetical protein
MKKLIFKTAFVFTLLTAGLIQPSLAQKPAPGNNSSKNYWVVETNLKQRNYSVVRFYNAADELIYEERLEGVYLNIARPKHVKRLNLALQQITDEPRLAAYQDKATQKILIASLYRW